MNQRRAKKKNIVCSERMTFKRKIFARKIDKTFFYSKKIGGTTVCHVWCRCSPCTHRAQSAEHKHVFHIFITIPGGTLFRVQHAMTLHTPYMEENTRSTMCRLRDYTLWWWSFHTTLYLHIYIIKNSSFFAVSRREPGAKKKSACVCFSRMKYWAFAQRCLLGAPVPNSSHTSKDTFVLYARIGGRTLHHTYPVNLCRIVF